MKDVSERCKQMEKKTQDLQASLEFSQDEVYELKHELNQLKQERKSDSVLITKLSEDLQASLKSIEELKYRCNYQEDYNRRNNLQFVGIEEDAGETWEQSAVKVCQLLENKLQLPNMQLERAHRVGQFHSNQHRIIIARFTRFCDREAVMRNVSKLRGSRIYINEDLCPASQEIKKAQFPLQKQARSEGKIAYFRHTKLIIKDKNYANVNEVNRPSRNELVAANASADVTSGGGSAAPTVPARAGSEAEGSSRVGGMEPADEVGAAAAAMDATAAAMGMVGCSTRVTGEGPATSADAAVASALATDRDPGAAVGSPEDLGRAAKTPGSDTVRPAAGGSSLKDLLTDSPPSTRTQAGRGRKYRSGRNK